MAKPTIRIHFQRINSSTGIPAWLLQQVSGTGQESQHAESTAVHTCSAQFIILYSKWPAHNSQAES